jgi:hypothetical protein
LQDEDQDMDEQAKREGGEPVPAKAPPWSGPQLITLSTASATGLAPPRFFPDFRNFSSC